MKNASTNEFISSAHSFYAQVKINNLYTDCLIDSGSQSNIISKNFTKGLKISRSNKFLRAANGSPIEVLGETTVNVYFPNDLIIKVDFVVSNEVAEPILGSQFLIQQRCIVDFSQNVMHVGPHKIQLLRRSERVIINEVKSSEQVTLGPRSVRFIKTDIIANTHDGTAGEALMLENVQIEPGVYIARSLFAHNQPKAITQIVNTNLKPYTIAANQTLGELDTVQVIHTPADKSNDADEWSDKVNDLVSEIPLYVSEMDKNRLKKLLVEFKDIFSQNEDDLGRCSILQHKINTGDAVPVKQPLRRQPAPYQEFIDKKIEVMLKHNIIAPTTSPWAANVVIVRKKNNSLRLCLDTRPLNRATILDAYPFPRIDESLEVLAGSTIFSTLDLTSYYFQLELDPADSFKTAFITRKGLYKFNVVPMGNVNSASFVQRTIDIVLSGLNFIHCLAYLDDVIVSSRDIDSHLDRLKEVFLRFREAQLKFNPQKCKFMRKEICFLGFKVNENGIAPDEHKVDRIKNWPVPRNLTESRAYKKFIRNFSQITRPLTLLTRKNQPFIWSEECQKSFEHLKLLLASEPILTLPRDDCVFVLDTDASSISLGAVLSQIQDGQEKVLAFAIRVLDRREANYSVTRRELLAIVHFVKYFRHFLLGKRFILRSDHKALSFMFSCKEPIGRLARWTEILSEFSFEIQFRPGTRHSNADSLSRYPFNITQPNDNPEQLAPLTEQILTVFAVQRPIAEMPSDWTISLEFIKEKQVNDPVVSKLRGWLENGFPLKEEVVNESPPSKPGSFRKSN